MRRPINIHTVPHGGFTLTFPSGFRIDSNHPTAFLAKAFNYMEFNEMDTGAGWQDRVWDMFCRQNPDVPWVEIEIEPRKFTHDDLRRFSNTMGRWISSGGKWVPQHLAESRAETCINCQFNVHVEGCTGCKGILNVLVGQIAGQKTSSDEHLQNCSRCSCFLRAKVHLPLEVMDNTGIEFPEWCWQKKELQSA